MEFNATNLINVNGGQAISDTVKVRTSYTFSGEKVKIDIQYFLSDSWASVKLAAIREEAIDIQDEDGNFIENKVMPVRSFMPNMLVVNVSELGNFEGVNGLSEAVNGIVMNAINAKL
jgi:hypothetical protein